MSFSNDLKDEIINTPIKSSCCRRAFFNGILSAKGRIVENKIVCSQSGSTESFFSALVRELFGKDTEVLPSPKGGRCKNLAFTAPSAARYLEDDIGRGALFVEKCPSCYSSFLKGVFFSAGRVSDPEKQFSLELSFGDRRDLFYEFFSARGMEFKRADRGEEKLLYTKNSSQIEDFFAISELQSATFAIMNTKIKKTFINDANRRRNFDTVNISKAVKAAAEQVKILEELKCRGLLTSLPTELEITARLRLENPDMSLSQLAMRAVPVISKSGLSHRMDRLMRLALEILSKY